jgi:hypothetical protein
MITILLLAIISNAVEPDETLSFDPTLTFRPHLKLPRYQFVPQLKEWRVENIDIFRILKDKSTLVKVIRQHATEETQPQERNLRAAMKKLGSTQPEIDKTIKEKREAYLDSAIEGFIKNDAR